MTVGSKDILVLNKENRIDDDVLQLLSNNDYRVAPVTAESKALSYIRHHDPSLVLIGQSPESDLYGFIREIRSINLQLPVVLLLEAEELPLAVLTLEQQGGTDYALQGSDELLLYVINRNIRYSSVDRRLNRDRIVIDNSDEKLQLLIQDQQAGLRVQNRMMPESPLLIGGIQFDYRIFPSVILSGDFINVIEIPGERIMFYLADVSGHGASSAFVTVLLRSLSGRLEKQFAELDLYSTGDILFWMNKELLLCDLEHHVTMFLGIIDKSTEKLEYSNAGHFPAAILNVEDDTRYLEIGGRPLGLFEEVAYETRTLDLPNPYTMIMFSDGVFEIMPQETLKDKEQHLLALVECGKKSVEALADSLNVLQPKQDDVAILTVVGTGQN
jgi:sigma-B regulation protein RsbU (phosphoserine phosphatase)